MSPPPTESPCLTDADLQRLAGGALDEFWTEQDWEAVESHLQACAQCREKVERHLQIQPLAADPLTGDVARPEPGHLDPTLALARDTRVADGGPHRIDARLPRDFGRYQLQEELGAGGMGHVYRAWDTRLKRACAIKLMRFDALTDKRLVQRFRLEATSTPCWLAAKMPMVTNPM